MSEYSSVQGGLERSIWADGHQGRNRYPSEHSSVVGLPRYNQTSHNAAQNFPIGQTSSQVQIGALAALQGISTGEQLETVFSNQRHHRGTAQQQTLDTNGIVYEQPLVPTGDSPQPYNPSKSSPHSSNYELLKSLHEGIGLSKKEEDKAKAALKATQNLPTAPGYGLQTSRFANPATGMPPQNIPKPKPERPRKVKIPPHLQPKGVTTSPQVDRKYAKLRHLFDEDPIAEDTEDHGELDLAAKQKAEQDRLNSEWYTPTPRYQRRPRTPDVDAEDAAMKFLQESKPVVKSADTRIEMPIPSRKHQEGKLPLRIQSQVSPSKAQPNRRNVETAKPTPVEKSPARYDHEGSLPPHLRRGPPAGASSKPNTPNVPADRSLPAHQQAKDNTPPHAREKLWAELQAMHKSPIGPQHNEGTKYPTQDLPEAKKALPPHLRGTSMPRSTQNTDSKTGTAKAQTGTGSPSANPFQQKENLPPHLSGRQPTNLQKQNEGEAKMKQPHAERSMPTKHVQTKEPATPAPVSKPSLGFTMTAVTTIYGDESPTPPKGPVFSMSPVTTIWETVPMTHTEFLNKIDADRQKAKEQLEKEKTADTAARPGQPSQDLTLRTSQAVQPHDAGSVGTPSERADKKAYKDWLAKGTRDLQNPRLKAQIPAQVWGRGLVGETRAPTSAGSPSTIYFDEHVDIDAEIAAAAATADQDLPVLVNEHVARSIEEEPKKKPRYSPPPEEKAFWTNEPGGQLPVEPEQVRCNVCIGNHKNYGTFKKLQEHKLHRHNYCIFCDVDFQDKETLDEHKLESPDHHCCIPCGLDFVVAESLKEHCKQAHPSTEAKIPCTRCGKKFVSGSALLLHFEKGGCKNLTPDQYMRSRYLMSHYQRLGLELTGDTREVREKSQALNQLSTYLLGEENMKEEFKRRYAPSQNPFDRAFDPTPLLGNYGRYICPYAACTFSSDKKGGITFHLQNGHFRQLTCPSCYEKFATPSAITAHMEKEARRCRFTHSPLFEDAIRAISGGFLRADGMNPDGTHRIIGVSPPNEQEMERRIQASRRSG
ncbi:hypothetical protein MMC10_003655 [Thelotrema lepadinum]|nr:hypothetical protein [Thelotrema lepadinum]